MIRLSNVRHGIRGTRRQAAAFHARERRKSLYDPAYELSRTHQFAVGDVIATAASFPADRVDEITFATTIKRTDTGSSGLVFEIGSGSLGVAVAVSGDNLIIAAGEAAASDAGVTLTLADALPGIGVPHRIVVAVRPGLGLVACWVNGRLLGAKTAVDDVLTAWTDTDDGSFAAAGEGTVLDRIDVGLQTAPTDFEVVAPLNVYRGQRPRQTPAGTVTLPTGVVVWTFDSTTITFDSTTETFDEA
jgi:hypothetical protein